MRIESKIDNFVLTYVLREGYMNNKVQDWVGVK